MNKALFFLSLFFIAACSNAQVKYSSSNKKAIKLFEQGQKAPGETLDPINHQPNYRAGIDFFN